MITYSDFEKYATGKIKDYAPFINHGEVYKVKINGASVPVYECNISKFPFNKVYEGFQRPESQTEKAYFINLFSDEPLSVEVTLSGVKAGAETAKLKPYAFGITPKLNGDKVTFKIERHGFFALHINDHHNPLYIFNSEIITPPEKSEVTYFVGAGVIRKDFRLKSGDEKKANFKWLIYSMLAMLSCTGIGLMQKTHQISAHKSEVIPFLIIAFLTCAALSALVAAIARKVSRDEIVKTTEGLQKSEKELLFSKKPILYLVLYAAISGVFTSIEHSFNLYLSGVMPTAVFFPLVNGIPLVLSIVFGFILLKQKLNKNQLIGLVSGVLGIAFVIVLTVIG